MKRTIAALAVLAFLAGSASAQGLEITNVRPSFGPAGATRKEKKLMAGDALWVNFDIDGLKADPKSGKLIYQTTMELFDANKKLKFSDKKGGGELIPDLGGSRAPSDFHVVPGEKFDPGKYTVRLTVTDKVSGDKKTIDYPVEIVPSEFGIYGVVALGIGIRAQNYVLSFGVAQFKLKDKKPNVEVNIRILDSNDKPVGKPMQMNLPQALPDGVDVEKVQFAPFTYPMFLNRTGQFTIEITATDRNASNKSAKLSFPLSVLEPGSK